MNKVIDKVEDSLFDEKDCALYKEINVAYSKTWLKIDVININIYISIIFVLIWTIILLLRNTLLG